MARIRRQSRKTPPKNPLLAAILSVLLPGLGQFYNREIGKGVGFLLGAGCAVLILANGLRTLSKANLAYNQTPLWSREDMVFTVGPFLIGCIIWSAMDAFRKARGPA
ncbi:MAG: hypothetical protein FJ245_06460 [Nitrospira sp.]|nr:hypothetical protein [Nitrospira sp.]